MSNFEKDIRPARYGWAPPKHDDLANSYPCNSYLCNCRDCGKRFLGAKHSWECSDCAYEKPEPLASPPKTVSSIMMEELQAYRDAAQYDPLMSGPRFKGWDRSQLERARKLTEANR